MVLEKKIESDIDSFSSSTQRKRAKMSYIPNKDSQNVPNRGRGTKRSRPPPHNSGHPNNSNSMIPSDVNDVGGHRHIHAGQSSNGGVGSDHQGPNHLLFWWQISVKT